MKRFLPKLTAFILMTFFSCQLPEAGSLDSIVGLYGGKFSLENGIRASTSEGKINYVKLVCESNKLINNGWLSAEAMANNCVIVLTQSNPNILDKNELIEVEINNTEKPLYAFKKQGLKDMEGNYNESKKMILAFVNAINLNQLEKAKEFMESSSNLSASELTNFLTTFKNVNMTNYKETKLIGFKQKVGLEKFYAVDFFIISQDGVQKMANALLIPTENGLKFREVNF